MTDVLCSGGCGRVQALSDRPDRHALYCAECERAGKNVGMPAPEAPSAAIRRRAAEIVDGLGKGVLSPRDAVGELASLLAKLP